MVISKFDKFIYYNCLFFIIIRFIYNNNIFSCKYEIINTYQKFPGIEAKSIFTILNLNNYISNNGINIYKYNVIVAGLDGTIVNYETYQTIEPINLPIGEIKTIFETFPGINVNAVCYDPINDKIIAVGGNSSVISYNYKTGSIYKVYEAFPGKEANTLLFDYNGNLIVAGAGGYIVRYNNDGQIDKIYDNFPGGDIYCMVLTPSNKICTAGKGAYWYFYDSKGSIINGTVNIYTDFSSFNQYTQSFFFSVPSPTYTSIENYAMIIDSNGYISSVGSNGLIIQAAPLSICSHSVCEFVNTFTGIGSRALTIDLNGNYIIGGYELNNTNIINIPSSNESNEIISTFESFPGELVNCFSLLLDGSLIVGGKKSYVCQYFAKNTFCQSNILIPSISINKNFFEEMVLNCTSLPSSFCFIFINAVYTKGLYMINNSNIGAIRKFSLPLYDISSNIPNKSKLDLIAINYTNKIAIIYPTVTT